MFRPLSIDRLESGTLALFEKARSTAIATLAIVTCYAASPCKADETDNKQGVFLSKVLKFLNGSKEAREQHNRFMTLNNDGLPFPLYVDPSKYARIRSRLPATTRFVRRVGKCTPDWCRVRLGSTDGWLNKNRIKLEEATPQPLPTPVVERDEPPSQDIEPAIVAAPTPSKIDRPPREIAIALPARKAPAPAPSPVDLPPSLLTAATTDDRPLELSSIEEKPYSLKGLIGAMFLAVRVDHEDDARILGHIPFYAEDVEATGLCINEWCLIRRGKLRGWIKRAHLSDVPADAEPRLRIAGLPPLQTLPIYEAPSADAYVLGGIQPPGTGIRPLSQCNRRWCNIQYFGLIGWVRSDNLAPQ